MEVSTPVSLNKYYDKVKVYVIYIISQFVTQQVERDGETELWFSVMGNTVMENDHKPSDGAGGIAARGQIYMGFPLGVVEIHLRAELPPLAPILLAPPLHKSIKTFVSLAHSYCFGSNKSTSIQQVNKYW